jgi:hypothetical protein
MPPRPDGALRGLLVAVFVAMAALVTSRAHAGEPQTPASAEEVRPAKKRTVLRFGEDDIRGDLTRPDGELVQAPRKPAQPSLLRVRRNFLDRALSGAQRGQ